MNQGKIVLDGPPREVFTSEDARLIGVGIPKATRLYQLLGENGIRLGEIPVTSQEASRLLQKMLGHD
jgi:hypothetical protein